MRLNRRVVIGGNHVSSGKTADCVEPSPRLFMAVVAIGVIVGALISPSAKSSNAAADAQAEVQHTAALTTR